MSQRTGEVTSRIAIYNRCHYVPFQKLCRRKQKISTGWWWTTCTPILSTRTQPRKCDFQAESSGTPSKSTRSKRMKIVIHNPGKIICSASYFCSDYTETLLMIEVTALKKPNSTLIYSGLAKLLYSIEIICNTSTLSVYESVVLCLQWWRKEKGVICLKISLWWDFVRIEIPSLCLELLEKNMSGE